jgi:hypothetical protein
MPVNAGPAGLELYRTHLGSMSSGLNGMFDQLDAYLAELQGK